MADILVIHEKDNVYINLSDGHKYARRDIAEGEDIIKYGFPIGHATSPIKKDEHVHSHNVKTNLSDISEYTYSYVDHGIRPGSTDKTFLGYLRKNGEVGIRNEIWVINTVGCINKTAETVAKRAGAKHFPHPFGCSQLGGDMATTAKVLAGLVNHPNAGGVLVMGLGCENTNLEVFKPYLGEYDSERVRFINCQDCGDEIEESLRIIEELRRICEKDVRVPVPLSKLRIGLKCGGSDGYSGITANPLCGSFCNKMTEMGASLVLTEVPEMFGAEHLLMERCVSKEIFDKAADMVNNYKKYFIAHNQPIYENPSPGNKKGGITTLEEKSLGCVQKGGLADITDVLDYGSYVRKSGLSLMNGPGNDLVAVTNLSSIGCHMVLFTTGRGTPFGGPVPTIKISTNSSLAERKPNWIDFNAGRLIEGCSMEELTEELLSLVIKVAEGKQTLNEKNGFEEISIFKDGVTL